MGGNRQWFPWAWLGFLLLAVIACLVALCQIARAEDYYCVSTTGSKSSGISTNDIDAFGWANGDCYGTIQAAVNQMGASDQCWVNDGSYSISGDVIEVDGSIDGSAGDFTVIRARNHGDAILTSTGGSGVLVTGASYIKIEGFHVAGAATSGAAIYINGHSDHIYVKRCSWAMETGLTTQGSTYCLWEDCFAFGGPHRYAFQTSRSGYDTSYNVFRRCVVRWDYSNITQPLACFATYTCDNTHYQNCIAINGTDYQGLDHGADGAKGFFTPGGSTNVSYEGCIVMGMTGFCGMWLEGSITSGTMTDCLIWNLDTDSQDAADAYTPRTFVISADNGDPFTLNRCTFGLNEWSSQEPVTFDPAHVESMTNSIIYGFTLDTGVYAVSANLNTEGYNLYYGNTGGRNRSGGVSGTSITDTDPLTAGLTYPPIIDPCSFCQTAGEASGQIGAQIRTKIGVDGTFYGDTDWDLDTGKPLWPFPYEDEIREKCAAFHMDALEAYSIAGGSDHDSPEMDGARGFCAPGETLTSYILSGGE